MTREHIEDLACWALGALGCGFCAMLWHGLPRAMLLWLSGACVGALVMALHLGAKGGAA